MENLGHRDTENADKNVGNEIMLGHRDTKNADRLLGHRDIKNADNLGHRDTETVDINTCGQTDTLKGTNRQTGERKKEERRKVGSRSRQDFGDLILVNHMYYTCNTLIDFLPIK